MMLDVAGSNEDELVVTLLVPPGSRSSSKIRANAGQLAANQGHRIRTNQGKITA